MKVLVRNALFLTTLSLLTACAQDTVDSKQISGAGGSTNNIDRSYDLIAREGSSEASFVATFRVSGTWNTTVRLSAPSQLTFDRRNVDDSQLLSSESATTLGLLLPVLSPFFYLASGTHYHVRTTAGSHQIQWTDQNGRAFIDQMNVVPCALVEAPTSISKADAAATWTANTQAGVTNMSFSGSLEQRKSDQTSAFASARSTTGRIAFTAADLSRFEVGQATLKIECQTPVVLDAKGSGRATGTSRYELQRTVSVMP